MKRITACLIAASFVGCKAKDGDIKKSVASNAKEEVMFAGINYVVKDGTVTWTGSCPSDELKTKAIMRVRAIGGVKDVLDNATVGPILLDTNFILKQKVDSVLAQYANVQSGVQNGVVTLNGEAKKEEVEKLLQELAGLKISSIMNNLSVK